MKMIEDRKAMAGQSGFTLIELLVVIAILAVLAGAAVIGIGAMRGNAEDQVCDVDGKTIETAAEAWALETANSNATTVTDADLLTAGYLKATVADFDGASRTSPTAAFNADVTAGSPC